MNGKIKSKIKNLVGNFYYSLFKKHQPTGNRALIYHAFGCKLEHEIGEFLFEKAKIIEYFQNSLSDKLALVK